MNLKSKKKEIFVHSKSNQIYDILIFILSTFGVLITFHLHATKLDPICIIGSKSSCTNLIDSLKLLGISNIYWGLLYYCFLVLSSIIANIFPLRFLIQIRNLSIIFGFLYSIFLVIYQITINQFCFLCLLSATICFTLFFLLIVSKFYKLNSLPKSKALKPKLIILTIMISLVIFDSIINKIKFNGEHDINIKNSIILGNPDADITIIKWTDFQ